MTNEEINEIMTNDVYIRLGAGATYTIDPNGVVHIVGDITIKQLLPQGFQVGTVDGSVKSMDNKVSSFAGFPASVTGNFDINMSPTKNLIGAPAEVGGFVKVSMLKDLASLDGFPKKIGHNIDAVKGNIVVAVKYSPDMGMLRPLLSDIEFGGKPNEVMLSGTAPVEVRNILNKYIGRKTPGERNAAALAAAAELIRAGHRSNARL